MRQITNPVARIVGLAAAALSTAVLTQSTATGPYYASPSWDHSLPASTRFVVLSNFDNQAVMDRET